MTYHLQHCESRARSTYPRLCRMQVGQTTDGSISTVTMSLALSGRWGAIQSAYLCHVYSALALNLELFYESVNALMNCRFLLLQGTTIKCRSKHLANYSVRLWIWISGNPSVLALDTLDFLSFDEG